MQKNLVAIIVVGMISVSLTGCAVYATPRHASIYIEPLPIVVSPVVVRSGWGYQGYQGNHRHRRRW
jgi:hypothetical protein